jgi:hypothetical protein
VIRSLHLLSNPPLTIRHRFEFDVAPTLTYHVHSTSVQPSPEILALANVKKLQVPAAFHHGFNARASDTHTTTYTEIAQFK